MCGIAGIIHFSADSPVPDELLERLTDAMAARGPDGEGRWLSPDRRVALGHRRLAVIDPTPAASQPFLSDDGRTVVLFNGEIYNYKALRADLEARGVRCRSQSDTEVLLHLYRLDGEAMLTRLRGMFALAVWDADKQHLLLARDAFGIKPLYFARRREGIAFASQVTALERAGLAGGIDPAAVVGFLTLGFVPEPFTIRREVEVLPGGTWLRLYGTGREERGTFADPRADLQAAHPSRISFEAIKAAFSDSVRDHMVADVPVGLFLSGGIDSCALLALAQAQSEEGLTAITLGFEELRGHPDDEIPSAAAAAAAYGVRHVEDRLHADAFAEMLPQLLAAMDQPSLDGINTYLVGRTAHAQGLKVCLSGLGGDELLGGYPSFRQVPRLSSWLGPLAALPGLGAGLRQLAAPVAAWTGAPKWAGLLEYAGSVPAAWLLRRAVFMPWELPALLPPSLLRDGWERLDLQGLLSRQVEGVGSAYLQVMILEMRFYMRDQLLRDADWAGMAHGVEVRTPFVDLSLFRTLLPGIVDADRRLGKASLAAVASPPLPDWLLRRPKTGFTVPLRYWMGGHGRDSRDGRRAWGRRLLQTWPGFLDRATVVV